MGGCIDSINKYFLNKLQENVKRINKKAFEEIFELINIIIKYYK